MSHAVQTEKPNVSSSAALWAVLIFVGLIVAAINFVQAESNAGGHGGHGGHEATEQHGGGAHGEGHEAAAGGHAAPEAAHTSEAATSHDNAAHGEHQEAAAPATHEEAHH